MSICSHRRCRPEHVAAAGLGWCASSEGSQGMRKLVQGIVDFRNRVRPIARETFARLALGQKPDVLFIACSDSRVAINVFASTEPGDLFVRRNPGNIVSPAAADGLSVADESQAAAIEFAVGPLKARDLI